MGRFALMPDDPATRLLLAALERNASDIHVEPSGDGCAVLFRVDGILEERERLDSPACDRLVSRFKILSDLPVYRRDVPMEGRLVGQTDNGPVHARVATMPTTRGEKVVVRLFERSGALERLGGLGLPDAVVERLRVWTRRRRGVILFTGPSGSGKTTTTYAVLRDIAARAERRLNICTIEDPVEIPLEIATQTEVQPEVGLTFAVGLRSLLRQDPDVLAVGEIRDRETAEIAIQAGLTGHLVLSSLHSGDTAETFLRLLDMGLEPYLVASAVTGVVAQRLVRVLDQDGTYRGRTALAEAVEVRDCVREAILRRPTTSELRREVASSMVTTLEQEGARKVAAGITSAGEVRAALAETLVDP